MNIELHREYCPICSCHTFRKPRVADKHPYVECVGCGFWTQQNFGSKVYEASHEVPGDTMSEADKHLNFQIAGFLYLNYLHSQVVELRGKESLSALDIGAKFPWLMHSLFEISQGKVSTWAIDGIPEIETFCEKYNLMVHGVQCDFEETIWEGKPFPWRDQKFDLVVMVHMIEHLYNPMDSLKKVHSILESDGTFFIRCPSSDVVGIERDFTPGHYDIHPQIWNNTSLEIMAAMIGFEIKMNNVVYPGQRDLILVKK